MLNDSRIRNATKKAKPYKLSDEKGLYIEVRPTGAKLWRYRYRIEGKENVFAMGEYFRDATTPGHVSLEQARRRRAAARDLVRQGKHPAQQRDANKAAQQAQNANTFESVARDWLAENAKRWTVRHGETITRALEGEVFPDIGALPIRSEAEVFAAAILKIMKRVEKYAPVKAISLRQWCSAVFSYGVRNLRAGFDPTTVLLSSRQFRRRKCLGNPHGIRTWRFLSYRFLSKRRSHSPGHKAQESADEGPDSAVGPRA